MWTKLKLWIWAFEYSWFDWSISTFLPYYVWKTNTVIHQSYYVSVSWLANISRSGSIFLMKCEMKFEPQISANICHPTPVILFNSSGASEFHYHQPNGIGRLKGLARRAVDRTVHWSRATTIRYRADDWMKRARVIAECRFISVGFVLDVLPWARPSGDGGTMSFVLIRFSSLAGKILCRQQQLVVSSSFPLLMYFISFLSSLSLAPLQPYRQAVLLPYATTHSYSIQSVPSVS